MTRLPFFSRRKPSHPNKRNNQMPTLGFETLEAKRCLAFSLNFVDGLMQIGQRVDDGDATLTKIGDRIEVTDGSGTISFDMQSRHQIYFLSESSTNLTMEIDSELNGVFQLVMGNGDRTARIRQTGEPTDAKLILGSLDITGGTGDQRVLLDGITGYEMGLGGLNVDLGEGDDSIRFTREWKVTGDFEVTNAESERIGLGRNHLTVDKSGTIGDVEFNAVLVEKLTYIGGPGNDTVNILNSAGAAIYDWFNISTGAGNDIVNFLARAPDEPSTIQTGDGDDIIRVATNSPTDMSGDFNFKMGDGDDQFVLESVDTSTGPAIVGFRVDFGSGDDKIINEITEMARFNLRLLNLDGFNAFYDPYFQNLDLIQVEDTGNVLVDDGGVNGTIQVGVSGTDVFAEMNPIVRAEGLRLIMLDNSSPVVTADFDLPRPGYTILQLRNGDRELKLTGDSNRYSQLLRVEAGDGVQEVNLAENAELKVLGTTIVNTRDGNDVLNINHDVNVTHALLLRGVNQVVHNEDISVGGDFNMITLLEQEETILAHAFDRSGNLTVGGNFTYLGGAGLDTINFRTTGADIAGYTYINVGESHDAENFQSVLLRGGFKTDTLYVHGATAAGGNTFETDGAAEVRSGITVVDFSESISFNFARFYGTYDGSYVTYRGGSAMDNVVIEPRRDNLDGLEFAMILGDGDDRLTVENGTSLDFLYADFGAGNDTLISEFGGEFPFDSLIEGLED